MSEKNKIAQILGWLRGLEPENVIDCRSLAVMIDASGVMHVSPTRSARLREVCVSAQLPGATEEISIRSAATRSLCEECGDGLVNGSKLLCYANTLMQLDVQAGACLPDAPDALAKLHFQIGSSMARSWAPSWMHPTVELHKVAERVGERVAETQQQVLVKLRSPEMRARLAEMATGNLKLNKYNLNWAIGYSDWLVASDVVIGISDFRYGGELDLYVLAFGVQMPNSTNVVMLVPHPVFKLLVAKFGWYPATKVASSEDGWAVAEMIGHLWDPADTEVPFSVFSVVAEAARKCICLPERSLSVMQS